MELRLLEGALFFLDAGSALLGILLGFLVGVVLHGLVQAVLADRFGDRQARVAGRISVDPRRHLDAFGVVGVLIAGAGWGKPVPFDERRVGRGRFFALLAVGPLVQVVLALGAFALWRLQAEPGRGAGFLGTLLVFFGLVNVASAVLCLTPLPPLEGNRALWSLAPRSAGWAKARHYSEEQNYGVAALVILLLPLFSGVGLLMRLVYAVGSPLTGLLLDLVDR